MFNDLAVTANRLIAERHAHRVLIVDLDVHQGDGTASLTAGRADIFTLSLHAEKNFPVRKARSSLDIGLPDGLDDDGYMAVLTRHLPQVMEDFAPDFVLYQAGVDPHRDDKLGRLALSDAGWRCATASSCARHGSGGFLSPVPWAAAMAMIRGSWPRATPPRCWQWRRRTLHFSPARRRAETNIR